MMPDYKHKDLSERIIGAFYNVYNKLGYGFLERVYENSLMIELERIGVSAKSQWPIQVYYTGKIVANTALIFWPRMKSLLRLRPLRN
jgi:GxxExxY protein